MTSKVNIISIQLILSWSFLLIKNSNNHNERITARIIQSVSIALVDIYYPVLFVPFGQQIFSSEQHLIRPN